VGEFDYIDVKLIVLGFKLHMLRAYCISALWLDMLKFELDITHVFQIEQQLHPSVSKCSIILG